MIFTGAVSWELTLFGENFECIKSYMNWHTFRSPMRRNLINFQRKDEPSQVTCSKTKFYVRRKERTWFGLDKKSQEE